MTLPLKIQNQQFDMHASGALYWTDQNMLLIADVHLGKVAHFRKHGAAIPASVGQLNFQNLDAVIAHYEPEVVCFLGDLFHSSLNSDWAAFEQWVQKHAMRFILVSGNHDIISHHKFEQLGFQVCDSWEHEGFALTHHPTELDQGFNIAGHIHPGVRMRGAGLQQLRLACFFKTERQMILPAFGIFTGKHTLTPKAGDQVYVLVQGEVVCVSENPS